MKTRISKWLRIFVVSVLSATFALVAASCGGGTDNGEKKNDTLVVAYANFSNKFSPYFATTAYDVDVYTLTQVSLLAGDRGGNVVYKGIEGETIPYNGTDYTYYGLGDLTVTQNNDGSVYYDVTIRSGDKQVYFSDGKPLTIKDVVFSMYAYSDVDYDGSTTFYSLPIKGMNEWRTNLSTAVYDKWAGVAGAIKNVIVDQESYEYVAGEGYSEEQFNSFANSVNDLGWYELANDIIGYCALNYASYLSVVNNNEVALGMYVWGFGDYDDEDNFVDLAGDSFTLEGDDVPSVEDYVKSLKAGYDGNFFDAVGVEAANGDLESYIDAVAEDWIATSGRDEMGDANVNSISGITYNEANQSVRIETTKFDAVTVYQLTLSVTPMHYYGDTRLWDPANGSYGFTRGNLDSIREKTTKPLGAGPYKFVDYKGGIVSFEANAKYWEGEPKTKYLKLKEYSADSDKFPALVAGDIDIATPSINKTVCDAIKKINKNGELSLAGDFVATDLVDYNGYGYIGIDANRVSVGNKASEASKNLRKAFATLFAAYREYTVNSYYEDRASVIEYPISNASWAAPQPADNGYAIAFSKDVNGNDIYSPDDKDAEKWAAAKDAAVGYFKAAGYTYDENTGKFTAAPEGAKLEYEVTIPGDGVGDHPTFALLVKVKEVLETVGISLIINDPSDSNELWNGLDAGTIDMWVAAWGGAADPDMYQVYHSDDLTKSNHYHIADSQLDELIMQARSSSDKVYRKGVYKQCLDIILDWAVEIPVYQRKDCTIYSPVRVNMDSITKDTTPYWSYLAEIHLVEMN